MSWRSNDGRPAAVSTANLSDLGASLYEIVQEYAAVGAHHRTGTAEDARTLDWFEDRLRALGATTERQPWSFDRYDAEWTVTVDGADVPALPLFYEGAGPDRDRILLTTPLSGWFRCAGERGTGIAVMLAVAERLAAEGVPILVNGNSGHELVDLGAHRFAETKPAARAIFHFGASVAAGERDGDDLRLTDGVKIRAWVPGAGAALAAAFAPLARTPIIVADAERAHLDSWIGEARVWCTLDRPLISLAGGFSLFHTPEDVPERATAPALLERVYHAAVAAARVLARSA